jgi:hypothetical protein
MTSLVIVAIVGLALARVIQRMLNSTTAQVEIAAATTNARSAVVAIPQELREIGYDTVPLAGRVVSDLEAIAPHRLTFRAMRGTGITCGTPTLTEFRILRPVLGLREPLSTDGFRLFVESDPNYALDDQWVPLDVSAIDYHSTCGSDSAIAITLRGPPLVDPASATPMAISPFFVGAPLRWFERVEYGPAVDPRNGLAYVGVRSLSLGEPELTPLIGPIADTSAFNLIYYGAQGSVLNPATVNPVEIRSIDVGITAATGHPVSLAGGTLRKIYRVPAGTRVALRNVLRP